MSVIGSGDSSSETGTTASELSAMQTASARARSTRQSVTVGALTTETSMVAALPNGTMSLTQSVLPVRVRQGSGWVPVNASLRVSGGRLVSVALPYSVSLSDGGTSVLATISTGGRSVSVSWPGVLPAPVVSGAVATYGNVLPGVDLAVTPSVTGFSEVLIVHTPAAAHDPGLASLRLGVTGSGVRVAESADGSLAAVTPGGQEVFRAAAPLMWDSSASGPVGVQASAAAGRAKAGPVALRSSAAGPGSRARLSDVGMRLGKGGSLTLAPSRAMLASAAADFPLYIDPTWQTTAPKASGFDMVQQTAPCNAVPYYNNENPNENEDSLGVGYFPSSWGSCYGTQNAYYVMPLPSVLHSAGLVVNLATFNASEDYSASCSTDHNVNLIATASINTKTDYESQPPWYTSTLDVAQNGTGVPDTAGNDINCDVTTLGPSSDSEQYGFTITHDMQIAVKQGNQTITLVMTESSQDSSGDSLKRFTNNPSMTVQYDIPPAQPVNLKVGDNTSDMISCPTSGTLPQLGGTNSGVDLTAGYSQASGENLTAYFQYWDVTAGQTDTTNAELSTTVAGSTSAKTSNPVTIPESAITKMSDNDTVDVKTWAEDPADQTSTPSTCSFKVYPTAPGGTTVTMTSSANPPMGSTATFTLAAATPADCTASGFEWSLDEAPVSGEESYAPLTSGATASVSIVVPSPGIHELDAYANCSNNINPADTGTASFTASGDLPLQCASWAKALENQCTYNGQPYTSEPFDNTLLSGGDGSCAADGGDGSGEQFVTSELEDEGWEPGGQVTVDGATFTLPDFGSCNTDNVLAANQQIAQGGQGSSLVFLATSSGVMAESNAATGTPQTIWGADATAPPIPANVGVTGTGCTQLTAFSGNDTGCQPAQGLIHYSDGTSQPYYLSVPDWVLGPSDIAAVTIKDWQNGSQSPQAVYPKIFAFSVPINPDEPVDSVVLPDVDDAVKATGLDYDLPTLHILGFAYRNDTTATPEAGGASSAIPAACGTCAWTGAYESPVEAGWNVSGGFGNQTIRLSVPLNVSAPAGTQIRIHLADPGFLSGDGDSPVSIGSATVATQASAGAPGASQAPQPLAFGGQPGVTLCSGCDDYSDPVTLSTGVTAGQDLLVSLYVANGSSSSTYPALGYLPGSMTPSGGEEWTSVVPGDQTLDTSASSFSSPSAEDSLLTGVDVVTSPATADASTDAPYYFLTPSGEPTVVVAGDNVIDNGGSNAEVAPDQGSPSDRIAGDLASTPQASNMINGQPEPTAYGFGVVDAGIENNQVQADGSGPGGVSLLARVDRDILQEPDVGTVVIDEGLEDLLQDGANQSQNAGDDVTTAYGQLQTILTAYGITIVFTTLTPCDNYTGSGSAPEDSCAATVAGGNGATVDGVRQDGVNQWIGNDSPGVGSGPYMADADCAVSSDCGSDPEELAGSYDEGDHVNLSPAGYAQAATTIMPADLFPVQFQSP